MNSAPTRDALTSLVVTLAVIIILADQLSKAWFVYELSSYKMIRPEAGFGEFMQDYFTRWDGLGKGDGLGMVTERYGPLGGEQMVWDPWVRWHLTTNTGAAWSIFEGNSFALSFVSLLIVAALVYAWNRAFKYNLGMSIACGAILGGALGNFLDRFRLKEVVDFVFVKIPVVGRIFPGLGDPYDFPIFNVADACAVCGTLALAFYLLGVDLSAMRKKKQAAQPAGGFKPYPGGMMLDDKAEQKLHEIDTRSLPPWEPPKQEPQALADDTQSPPAQIADSAEALAAPAQRSGPVTPEEHTIEQIVVSPELAVGDTPPEKDERVL
ncbi:signal peptidase II [bacterium]|nr:signal peptidase II [bacterium]